MVARDDVVGARVKVTAGGASMWWAFGHFRCLAPVTPLELATRQHITRTT